MSYKLIKKDGLYYLYIEGIRRLTMNEDEGKVVKSVFEKMNIHAGFKYIFIDQDK